MPWRVSSPGWATTHERCATASDQREDWGILHAVKRRNHPFAWLAIFAILFAQLATAAYACPQLVEPPMAQSDDCGRDMASPNLCERHCEYGNASLESGKPLALPDGAVAFLRPIPV